MKFIKNNISLNAARGLFSLLAFLIIAKLGFTQNLDSVYKPSSIFVYDVQAPKSKVEYKTLTLTITDKLFLGAQMKVVWSSKYIDNRGYTIEDDATTGVVQSDARIWLHPPRYDYFGILENYPFPEIRAPLELKNIWSSKIDVMGGHKDLNGKKVVSHYEIIEVTKNEVLQGINGTLVKIDAYAQINNEGEKLQSCFLFHDKIGFVQMVFYEDGKPLIEFKLIED